MVNFMPLPFYTWESSLVLVEQEAGWDPEAVQVLYRREKSSAPAGICSPDHLAIASRYTDCAISSVRQTESKYNKIKFCFVQFSRTVSIMECEWDCDSINTFSHKVFY